ncbi:hypothetical protein CDCA_CDCA02G0601 [Cyanidium caldarium]|uniref:PsbP C-terminal domain-containing protein n=1 Tax=Cyanidium caldarium TaxID=2771 RepID=A0AAV9IQV2_CYACA|nr:hypothetical protein CDCA_CDCA02G0601 [Cyanidium caldarium]
MTSPDSSLSFVPATCPARRLGGLGKRAGARCAWRMQQQQQPCRCSRRELLLQSVGALLAAVPTLTKSPAASAAIGFPGVGAPSATTAPAQSLPTAVDAVFTGPREVGLTFKYPSQWKIKRKLIKTHLFEVLVVSDTDSSSSVGVVCDPVRIERVVDFGTPEDIGKRVIELEKKKDGVLSAALIRTRSLPGTGPTQPTYYICEYRVNTTRGGDMHYMAKVTIANKQLYVLTAQAKEPNWKSLNRVFQQMVDSFQVTPKT